MSSPGTVVLLYCTGIDTLYSNITVASATVALVLWSGMVWYTRVLPVALVLVLALALALAIVLYNSAS